MRSRKMPLLLMVFALLTCGGTTRSTAQPVRVIQAHMGMPVTLTVWADDAEAARKACAAAFERVAELTLILSDYEPDSELSRLIRQAGEGPVVVSEELFTVLAASVRIAELSNGLLDPTAAPVIHLWRQARHDQRLPDKQQLQAALARVGYEKLRLDPDNRTVELVEPGMLLDLGAIAKGYIGDEALKVLRARGFSRAAFSAGGDLVLGDPPPGTDGWPVEPEHAHLPHLTAANCAVAMSGDTAQFIKIDGRRYSHVIDPRTGAGITTRQTCLVRAPTGLVADPLATLGTIMPPDEFRKLVTEHFPEARVWVVPTPTTRPES